MNCVVLEEQILAHALQMIWLKGEWPFVTRLPPSTVTNKALSKRHFYIFQLMKGGKLACPRQLITKIGKSLDKRPK